MLVVKYLQKLLQRLSSSKDFVYVAGLVVIAIITHVTWFNLGGGPLFSNDWHFRPDNIASEALSGGYASWLPYESLGGPNIQLYTALPAMAWGLFQSFGLAERVIYLIPIALLSLITPYILFRSIRVSRLSAFLASLAYGFSTYMIMRSQAHLLIAVVNAIAPLILWAFIRFVQRPDKLRAAVFVAVFTIGTFYEVRIMFLVSLALLIYWYLFAGREWAKRNFRTVITVGVVLILLSLFWIIPSIFASSQIADVASRGLWGDNLQTLSRALALSDYNWTFGAISIDFIPKPIQPHLWFVPIVAVIGIISFRKADLSRRRYILFFTSLVIFGILFAKQSDPPFSGFYEWAYLHVPGFNLFREASKYLLLISLGYAGLFAFGIDYLRRLARHRQVLNKPFLVGAVLVAGVLLVNAVPLATGWIGGLMHVQREPKSYQELDALIKQPGFARTLWIPLNHQYGYYDLQHPKISLWNELNKSDLLKAVSTVPPTLKNFTNPELYTQVLTSPYGQDLLDKWSVKTVVVPPVLPESVERIFPLAGDRKAYVAALDAIPYLKKRSVGDIDAYQNSNPDPYIRTTDHLASFANLEQLLPSFTFSKSVDPRTAFEFTNEKNSLANQNITFPFASASLSQNQDTNIISGSIPDRSSQSIDLYKETSAELLSFTVSEGVLEVDSVPLPDPEVNGQTVEFNDSDTQQTVYQTDLEPDTSYALEAGGLTVINSSQPFDKTIAASQFKLSALEENLVPNSSFEFGAWTNRVNDCRNYDRKASISMNIDQTSATDGEQSLRLNSAHHDACTSTSVPLTDEGFYILEFDYKSLGNGDIGWALTYGEQKVQPQGRITSEEKNQWNHYIKKVTVPKNAGSARLYLYAFEPAGKTQNSALFDSIKLRRLDEVTSFANTDTAPSYEKATLQIDKKATPIVLTFPGELANLVQNGSFENGPWHDKVGDCHDYDDQPRISMGIADDASTGHASLALSAVKHDACAGTGIGLQGKGNYLLAFDYKGIKAEFAGYHIRFDDPAATVISKKIKVKNQNVWNHVSDNIAVPDGATSARFTIYAYEPKGGKISEVDYDNISLQRITDLSNAFVAVSHNDVDYQNPAKIQFYNPRAAQKGVSVIGAAKKFILNLSESYNDQWKLYLAPVSQPEHRFVQGGELKYLTAKPLFDDTHMKLNGFANGWVVDPDYVKKHFPNKYWKENPDGTIDFNLVMYYRPQSYFYLGLIIFGLTVVGGIIYLVVPRRRRRAQK